MAWGTTDPQGGGGPSDAPYLTTTAVSGLSAESNLGGLSTGSLLISVSGGTATPSVFAHTATRITFGSGTAGLPTDSADLTWHDTNKTLTLSGADADQVINATSGVASLDLQKNGTSAIKLRTGTSGHNIDFAANTTNYLNVTGAGSYIGMNVNAKEYLFRATGFEMPEACNVILGTTTGTKFGTATTQKLGFYNATPVVQRTVVADPSGGATQDAEARTAIIAVITRLEELGLFASA
jgi:hypothetical protein